MDVHFPPPDITPVAPPYFTLWRRFALPLHPLLPPNLTGCGATIHLGGSPTCQPPLLTVIPSLSRRPQVVPHASLWLQYLIRFSPLFCPWPAPRSLSSPGGSPVLGYLPPSACLCRPHICSPPPAGLYRRPIPLPILRVFCSVLLSPVPCTSALTSPCSEMSRGAFWSLISLWVSSCARLRGQGASTPWLLLAQSLAPALLDHDAGIQDNPPPPRPCPSPLVLVIPSLPVKVNGA